MLLLVAVILSVVVVGDGGHCGSSSAGLVNSLLALAVILPPLQIRSTLFTVV